jgi:hypothetical protein
LEAPKAPEFGQTSPSQGKRRLREILAGCLSCHENFLIGDMGRRRPLRHEGQFEMVNEN